MSSQISNNLFIRKLGHFSEYTMLGFWAYAHISNYKFSTEKIKNSRYAIVVSLVFSFLYAASDEFHQTFVAGRDGNIKDVLLDTSGALFGIIIASSIFYYIFCKKK